ncbi:MAG: response regulator [Elusimicrobia bacterium]|nr:response regulator [Elusimicrobiota bacterium]
MKVLVAEDDPSIQNLLRHVIGRERHEVLMAQDGEEALFLYRVTKPDLLILDINMPKMTGFDVLHEIRKEDNQTPVIVLTIRTAIEDQVQSYQDRADYYLAKPFEQDVLLAYVRAAQKHKNPFHMTARALR